MDHEDSAPRPYESPQVKLIGSVTDLTLGKPGIYFDYGHATEGANVPPAPGTPGTGTS
jgi:hypothetical protein